MKPGYKRQGSMQARAAARRVVQKMNKGEKIVMKDILLESGYSETTARQPQVVTCTDSYKEEIELYTVRLEKERTRVLTAMTKKDLNDEQYRTLVEAQTKLTHDVQLLSGGKTENVGLEEDRKTLKAIIAAIQIEE